MTKAVQDLMVEVERVRDAFGQAVFGDADPDAAVELATPDCRFEVVPAGVAAGSDRLHDLVAGLARPDDLAFERITRTVDRWRVADEQTVSFTHDRPMPWLLGDLAPTHRRVALLAVTLVTVRRSKVQRFRMLCAPAPDAG